MQDSPFLALSQDRNTKESRGFAFVRFFDKRDAEARARTAPRRHAAAALGAAPPQCRSLLQPQHAATGADAGRFSARCRRPSRR
jgi:hypothetical protein